MNSEPTTDAAQLDGIITRCSRCARKTSGRKKTLRHRGEDKLFPADRIPNVKRGEGSAMVCMECYVSLGDQMDAAVPEPWHFSSEIGRDARARSLQKFWTWRSRVTAVLRRLLNV
jgi:hypothetical protein